MELTKAQKFLIQWLKIIGCSEDETIGIIQMADTPSMLDELMDFMAENPDEVTPQDVLKKLAEILRKTNGERTPNELFDYGRMPTSRCMLADYEE